MKKVTVLIGTGSIGMAIACRVGVEKHLVADGIADTGGYNDLLEGRNLHLGGVLEILVPNLIGRFVEGDNNNLGTYKSAGLPNIRGTAYSVNNGGGAVAPSGALYNAGDGTHHLGAGNYTTNYTIGLNANFSSNIYRDSVTTVQHNSLCLNYIIKYT